MNAAAIREARDRLAKVVEESASMIDQLVAHIEHSPFEAAAQVERERIARMLGHRLQQMPINEYTRRDELQRIITLLTP